jgi:hypothetical protein
LGLNASPVGFPPTDMVEVTALVAVEIALTVPEARLLAT